MYLKGGDLSSKWSFSHYRGHEEAHKDHVWEVKQEIGDLVKNFTKSYNLIVANVCPSNKMKPTT